MAPVQRLAPRRLAFLAAPSKHTGRSFNLCSFTPAKPLEVVMFTSEEPTRFGLSCSGSRAMAGASCGAGTTNALHYACGRQNGACHHACCGCPPVAACVVAASRCRSYSKSYSALLYPAMGLLCPLSCCPSSRRPAGPRLPRHPVPQACPTFYPAVPPFAGLLDPAYLDTLRDVNGSTYLQAATAGGAERLPAG